MNILLTGATGFLGSHLLKKFLRQDHNVIVVKRYGSDISRIINELPLIRTYDIESVSFADIFSNNQIDAVVNTVTNYGRSGGTIAEILDANILFPCRILECAIRHNVKYFINTDTLLSKSINSYALSKYQFVEWLNTFSQKINVINFKIEHMYGPYDDNKKFVTRIAEQLINNTTEIALTEGKQKRDFIYIDDITDAYELVIDKISTFQGFIEFDIGSGVQTEVREMILRMYDIIAKNHEITTKLNFGAVPMREGEAMEITENLEPIYNLGWNAKTELSVGLEQTVNELINRFKK